MAADDLGSRLRSVLRRIPGIVVVPVLAFLALGAWGLSSPPGSSPDDDYHLTSIWCALGDREGLCAPGATEDERTVERDLVLDSICYAFESTVSAACQGEDFGSRPDDVVSTDRGNFAQKLYPPVFYATMGLFASTDIHASVLVMRAVNAALFIGLAVAAYLLLPLHRRGPLVAGTILVMVPLGMFLIPSINASSWALASAAVLWIATVGYLETTGRRRVGLGVLAAVATLVGAGARGDAALYSIAGLAIAVFLTFKPERRYLLAALLPVGLAVAAAAVYLTTAQSTVAVEGFPGNPPAGASEWLSLFLYNLVNAPNLWMGVVGGWSLGWVDTPIPALVPFVGVLVFAATLVYGLRRPSWRIVVVIAGLFVLLAVLPSYLLTQDGALVGVLVQPRYIMPLMVILVGVAVYGAVRGTVVSRPLIVVGVTGLAVANALALFFNTLRYVHGLDTFTANLDANPEWWWSAGPSPMTTVVIGSVAFAGMLAVAAVPLWRRARADAELTPAVAAI